MGRECAEKSEGLAAAYEETAKLCGCHYMDANKVISHGPNTVDYMHLTAEGHRQLADALTVKIRDLLEG